MVKNKLLFISSRPIFPIIGGDQIRTAQQLDFLKDRFDVDVLYISSEEHNEIPPDYKKNLGKVFRFRVGKIQSIIQTLKFLFNKLPLQVNYYYNTSVAKKINAIISNYDYVFCNNIRTSQYVIDKVGIIKYLDFVDAISMNYDKARYEAKGLKKLIYEIDYRRCREYEQQCLNSFDSCAIISEIDNQYISNAKIDL